MRRPRSCRVTTVAVGLIVSFGIAGTAPTPAGAAATVAISGPYYKTITYTADPDVGNDVDVILPDMQGINFYTAGPNILTDSDGPLGCQTITESLVRCPRKNVTLIKLIGSEHNDGMGVWPNIPIRTQIEGRGGDDRLTGGQSSDQIRGGEGDDTLAGVSAEISCVLPITETDNDSIWGGPGADEIDGYCGNDSAYYDDHTSAVTASLSDDLANDGNAEDESSGRRDRLVNIENLVGTAHDGDTLIGSNEPNIMVTLGGNDNSLYGAGGDDVMVGGPGNDAIADDFLAPGWGNDTILGGQGADTLSGGRDQDTILARDHVPGTFVFWPDEVDCGTDDPSQPDPPGYDKAQFNTSLWPDSVNGCEVEL